MTREDYQPIEALPEEERHKIEGLEEKTDTIWNLHLQLASFYRTYGDFLPEEAKEEEGESRRWRVEDLAQRVAAGEKFEDFIPRERIKAEAAKRALSPRDQARQEQWLFLQVRNAFERVLRVHDELRQLGGAWSLKRTLSEEEQEIRNYYQMRWREQGAAVRRIDELEAKLQELEELRDLALSETDFTPHPENIALLDKEHLRVFEELKTFIQENPEAYFYMWRRHLKETKTLFDASGRIVETPYVKAKLVRIKSLSDQGRPVFIHGELGTGKTELAKHLARTKLSAAHLARWEAENPRPAEPKALQEWEARRADEAEALVISGHRGIEQEQILAARTIERRPAPPPAEQARLIEAGWQDFLKTLSGRSEEGINELRETYKKAHQEFFRSPVETRVVLAPFLRAMKEGRPVIIDEMNAIPHHVLIILNDLLGRRPGEMVTSPFPGEAPFRVRDGFAVITTGNYKPEDGVMYVGRQPLDAAFLSRFGIVAYDYLPAQRTLEPPGLSPEEQRKWRGENELLHMLVTRLLSKDLSVTLPEGSFEKLRRLAMVARVLQDIFSGRDVNSAYYAEVSGAKVKPQEVLKENVLSIRHLLPILDLWKREGFNRPLDDYIFLEFIARSDARPAEKQYLYSILKVQGDYFPDEAEWPSSDQKEAILHYPIDKKMYEVDPQTGRRRVLAGGAVKMRVYSPNEVIEELYGPAPKRTKVPRAYLRSRQEQTPPPTAETTTEDELARARKLREIASLVPGLKKEGYNL